MDGTNEPSLVYVWPYLYAASAATLVAATAAWAILGMDYASRPIPPGVPR
jgi:hypothetical protein